MRINKTSPVWVCSKDDFLNIITTSNNITEALRKLGLRNVGRNDNTLKRRIGIESADTSHWYSKKNTRRIPTNDEIFIEDCPYSRHVYRSRILKHNILPYKCFECKRGPTWRNKLLTLHLDHINGLTTDCRLINLRFLCPNCHSQTPTFGSKNKINSEKECSRRRQNKQKTDPIKEQCLIHNIEFKKEYIGLNCELCDRPITRGSKKCRDCSLRHTPKKMPRKIVNRPSTEILIKSIELCGYLQTGRVYNVSDNTIRKWLRYAGIDYKGVKKSRVDKK